MPLTDLIRYLNKLDKPAGKSAEAATPFYSKEGKVLARFSNLELSSCFLPVIDTRTKQVQSHMAELQALHVDYNLPLTPHSIFTLPMDSREFIYLDRLVRTLHALNYLAEHIHGRLLLRVHPQHVLNVRQEHGQVFEELLHTCGLQPELVILRLEMDRITPAHHLKQAVASYKTRGYQIAIHRFGRLQADYRLLKELGPEVVHLDTNLLRPGSKLKKTCHQIHSIKANTLVYEQHSLLFHNTAFPPRIDLIQKQTPVPPGAMTHTTPDIPHSLDAA